MKKVLTLIGLAVASLAGVQAASDQYWRTDGATGGIWTTSAYWSNPASSTGGTAWTSGNNAIFTAASTLTFNSTGVGNVTVNDGVTVTVTQSNTLSVGTHDITVGTGATLTWTGQKVSDNSASSFTKDGAGTWNIGSQTNNYTGGFTLNAGTVIVTGAKAFGIAAMAINGGTIQSSGGLTYGITSLTVGADFTFAGTGNDTWGAATGLGSTTRTITNNTTSTATRTFSGVISGSGGITLAGTGGSGGIVFSNANTYTGDTKVSGGLLVLSNALALQNSALDTSGAGAVTLSSVTTPTFGGLKGSTNLASVITSGYTGVTGITLNPGTGVTDSYSGIIANGSGATTLTKTGAGTQTLSGANTYTGTTTVNAGTLVLSGGGTIGTGNLVLGGGTLSVASITGSSYALSGTQSLTGSGTILGAAGKTLTVAGALAPGSSSTSTITLDTVAVTLSGTSTFEFTNTGFTAGSYDLVQGAAGGGTESVAFGGTLNLNFSGGTYTDGSTVKIFDVDSYSGGFTVSYSGLGVGQSATFNAANGIVTVVPEPKTWVLIGIGSSFMMWNLRRRRNLVG